MGDGNQLLGFGDGAPSSLDGEKWSYISWKIPDTKMDYN